MAAPGDRTGRRALISLLIYTVSMNKLINLIERCLSGGSGTRRHRIRAVRGRLVRRVLAESILCITMPEVDTLV